MNSAELTGIDVEPPGIEAKRLGTEVKPPDPRDHAEGGRHERAAWSQAVPPSSAAHAAPNVAEWLCGLLQAGDSFYPTGSYAHSFGLEGFVQAGVVRDRDTLRAFLFQAALPALRHTELPLATHAWRGFKEREWKLIGELCVLSSALRTSREARTASENIGRQRVELAANLRDSPLARDFLQRAAANAWPCAAPVAAALEGSVLGVPLDAVLAGVFYSNVASLLSAAMKILRLGQNGAQSLLTAALSLAPEIIASSLATPIAEIGWFNPWLDIAAARHEDADARIFIS